MTHAEKFETALPFILQWEGGYSNDPVDPGGATNFGIIQSEYDRYRKVNKLATRSVRSIEKAEYEDIYFGNYWLSSHANGLPLGLDLIHFDCAINCGVRTAIKMLHTVYKLPVNIVFTNELSHAIHATENNEHIIATNIDTYKRRRRLYYLAIVFRRPLSGKFLKGWLNRLNNCYDTAVRRMNLART